MQHGSFWRGKKMRRVRYPIWHVVCWSLLFHRNCIIFHGEVTKAHVALWQIQTLSWSWPLQMGHCTLVCSFVNWCLQPFVRFRFIAFLFSFRFIFYVFMLMYSCWGLYFVTLFINISVSFFISKKFNIYINNLCTYLKYFRK